MRASLKFVRFAVATAVILTTLSPTALGQNPTVVERPVRQEREPLATTITVTHVEEIDIGRTPRQHDMRDRAALDRDGRCERHHVDLVPAVVKVWYGFTGFNPDHVREEKKHYPNAVADVYGGGCIGGTNETALVLQCHRCIEVR